MFKCTLAPFHSSQWANLVAAISAELADPPLPKSLVQIMGCHSLHGLDVELLGKPKNSESVLVCRGRFGKGTICCVLDSEQRVVVCKGWRDVCKLFPCVKGANLASLVKLSSMGWDLFNLIEDVGKEMVRRGKTGMEMQARDPQVRFQTLYQTNCVFSAVVHVWRVCSCVSSCVTFVYFCVSTSLILEGLRLHLFYFCVDLP